MQKTEMLYMKDNYCKTFSAKVIGVGLNYVILDQTAFYPLGGGQECDLGTITYNNKIITINNVLKESGEVRHFIEESTSIPPLNTIVNCEIDWNRRYIHMRYHTAIHIISRYMQLKYNADVVGNNISTRNSHVDFNLPTALSTDQLKEIEKDANEIFSKNLPIKILFMEREHAISFLKEKDYQTEYINMVPPAVKIFRIIAIGNYDYASCAGTHLANTKEIGYLEIVKRRSMGVNKERIFLSLK